MKTWLSRLFGAARTPPPPRDPVAVRPVRPAAPQLHAPQPPARDPLAALHDLAQQPDGDDAAFLGWLTGRPAEPRAALDEAERRALERLDRLIASAQSGSGSSLLPRSAAVVPRLLARLRGETVSLPELAAQVARDLTLVAEVVRMANGAGYRTTEPAVTVEQAIRVLGVDGLRRAIARAVLKPLIDPPSGGAAQGTQRLWDHTDKKAQLCAALAAGLGLDAFDGYLLGLVHGAAWSVVLRSTEGSPAVGPGGVGTAYAAALAPRRERLFGLIARQWQLPEGAGRIAGVPSPPQAGAAPSPQQMLLVAGHRLASRLCGITLAGDAAPSPQHLLGEIGPAAEACYRALAQPAAAEA